ncbi:MAG: NAD-binding protein [Clostridia bacterium]|nr:NAD-binding protein [Clostridia bacterium]
MFQKIGGNIFYLGPIGSGQLLKMCNNIVVANTTVALAEAFTIAAKAGVSPKTVFDIFKVSTANSRALELYGKLMVEGSTEETSFACKHMCKDVNLFIDLANDLKTPVLLSGLTHHIYNAAVLKGYGNFDNAAACKVVEELTEQKIAN